MSAKTAQTGASSSAIEKAATYPLIEALLRRRSRRFAKGMKLDGGPLSFASTQDPQPLTHEEEAILAFAACGITGYTLAELPFQNGNASETGGGNILIHFIGRTVASGDAVHAVALFVLNDGGVWLLKRPQDYPRYEVPSLVEAARAHDFAALYDKSRVRIADRRLDVPRTLPHVPPFNTWSANQPGTTYFLPVNELTGLYINILLSVFSEDFGYFLVDERRGFQPAGIGRFARGRGGSLHDDPADGRVATIALLETWLYEFAAFEQGQMLQNLALAAEALGLGGFPHFAAHPFGWMQALNFRMEDVPFAHTIGAGRWKTCLLALLRKNHSVPTAVGLERRNEVLLKPFCPPHYPSMKEAVLAFVDYKYGVGRGTLRDGGSATAWRNGSAVQAGIPGYSDQAIEATIAYCDYVYRRYGRFPANSGPFRTLLAYQAHHLDPAFYEQFYKKGSF
jgi:hypothetical protein